jgi:hypothetical protein
MKRVIATTAAVLVAGTYLVSAMQSTGVQQGALGQKLPEVVKAEEERKKTIKKPSKVYTNTNLKPEPRPAAPPPSTAPSAPSGSATPGNATPGNATPGNASPAAPTDGKDQGYWSSRIGAARAAQQRTQMFADSLQSRINALTTDFVNRDNPVERQKIEETRKASLAELERVKKELADHAKTIADIEDEARRANVPAAWLRPR